MGRVTYPFLFSTSFLLTSAGLFTHSSILRTGIEVMSLVRILSGAVNLGVFGFSPFPAFPFRDFETGFGFCFSSSSGELDGTTGRPLRVLSTASSIADADCGVAGEAENMGGSFYHDLAWDSVVTKRVGRTGSPLYCSR